MSIAAYPLQSAIPSYADFELRGGQNNGSAFVLRGQPSGAPTIMRPRVTPIQEASMSVALNATVNTLFNNPATNGWEGLAPTVELLKITDTGFQRLWNNGLFGQSRPDLWITEKRDWHQLTWITEIPQLGADLINIGLVNKCPSGHAKVSNLSLTNHYSRYYESLTEGESSNIALTRLERTFNFWVTYGTVNSSATQVWWEAYLDTIPLNIRAGESVTQNGVGIIGCISDSDSDIPIRMGITVKYRGRNGQEVFKEVTSIDSETPVIDDREFFGSVTWVADQDYTMAEPILFLKTKYGRIHSTTASHKGIKIDITSTQSLLSSR